MRIALLGPTHPFRGGISLHTTSLCDHLRRHDDVELFSFARQYPRLLYPGGSDRDPSATVLRCPGAHYVLDTVDPRTWLDTARRIVASGCDVLLIPWWTAYFALPYATIARQAARAGVPTVFLCHNVTEHDSNRWKRWLAELAFGRAAGFLCQCDDDLDLLRRRHGERPARRLSHPASATWLTGSPSDTAQTPGESRRLLFFGYVKPYKGLDVLLHAMREIYTATGATLDVVGEVFGGAERYRRIIRRLGLRDAVRCHFRYVANEEVGGWFDAADLVVLPYRTATASGVAELAFDCGKPVVASAVGALCERVSDGVNGRLVAPGDPSALARAVIEALEPAALERFGRGVRDAPRYSWDDLVAVVRTLLADVVREWRRP